ncbi:MAG: hypothetical protein Aureis2KO_29950 [Aureisphaera sp.]
MRHLVKAGFLKCGILFLFFFNTQWATSQVGIGTTNPSNQLDVMGWVELGDESQPGNEEEGTLRYNSSLKCIQFYDGSAWQCIGRPKIQNFVLRDRINSSLGGNVNNIIDYNGGGYSAIYNFVVNDVQAGDTILFLIELVVDDNLRKNSSFTNCLKVYGNGIFKERDMPGINMEETFTTFIWSDGLNASGNLTFAFEVNMDMADARITTVLFR